MNVTVSEFERWWNNYKSYDSLFDNYAFYKVARDAWNAAKMRAGT